MARIETAIAPNMIDYELQKTRNACCVTGSEFQPGEPIISAVVREAGVLNRVDYSVEAWIAPPENCLAWWKTHAHEPSKRPALTPSAAILQAFDHLAQEASDEALRYLLALLLIRRRVFRHEGEEAEETGRPVLNVYCSQTQQSYKVPVVTPEPSQVPNLELELIRIVGPSQR